MGPSGPPRATARGGPAGRSPRKILERETGIEPATNSLEGCDSTTELLPPSRRPAAPLRRFGGASPLLCRLARCATAALRRGKPISHPLASCPPQREAGRSHHRFDGPSLACPAEPASTTSAQRRLGLPSRSSRSVAKAGGEGRIRTSEAARATDLQSAAFDRFATSPQSPTPNDAPPFGSSVQLSVQGAQSESAICLERFGFLRRARVGRGPDIGAGEGI